MSARYAGRTPETHPDTESVQLQTALFPELAEARAWAREAAGDTAEGGNHGDPGTAVDGPGGRPDRAGHRAGGTAPDLP